MEPSNIDVNEILFRCSSLGHLMTKSRDKSNIDKYNDAVALLEKKQSQISESKNKETKTYKNLESSIID